MAKWDRFEHSFRSAIKYQQPYEDVELNVTFTSPDGRTNTVLGFWDGDLTWRVRFAPDLPGAWKFSSACSDEENDGLQGVRGEFICTAASGKARFGRHGPLRRARGGLHFEHGDGTPFLWLADTAWQGGMASTAEDWSFYAGARAHQGFSAVQWAALPAMDPWPKLAFESNEHRRINPAYFQALDEKVTLLNQAGLLNVIAPFQVVQTDGRHPLDLFPEEEIIRLLRYMMARWSADQVAWLLPCEADDLGQRPMQWQRVGKAVFENKPGALVILHPGDTYWAAKELRAEPWVNALAYESGQSLSDDSWQWLLAGPFTQEWRAPSPLPVLNLGTVLEHGLVDSQGNRAKAADVRRVLYTSLLNSPPAGVGYGAQGVWDWNQFEEADDIPTDQAAMPVWRKALFLPGARQMAHLAQIFSQFDWWRLRPEPGIVFRQPGQNSPSQHIAAARSATGDLTVVYVPEVRTVEISIDAIPPSPKINWHQPATGKISPAVAVVGGRSCQFPTPEPGDWLLVMKSQKQ